MRQITALAGWVGSLLLAHSVGAEVLPYEIGNAMGVAGRIRRLAQELSKENVLYQFHLGDTHRSDVVATAAEIDRGLEMLAAGAPSLGIPEPWTPDVREQVRSVQEAWAPLRAIATASPYEYLRQTRQFMEPESRLGDPLSLRYFDRLSLELVAQAEKLLALLDQHCRKTDYALCAMASASGYSEMLIERSTKEAVLVFAGIDVEQNKARLKETVAAFQQRRAANEASDFFKAAMSPEEGKAGEVAAELIGDVRRDWDEMRAAFDVLQTGKTPDFDLYMVLKRQRRVIENIERFSVVMRRFADRSYGV